MDEHKQMLYRGRDEWNKWRKAQRELALRPDLRGLRLSRYSDDPDLAHYDLSDAQLTGAVLSISLERAVLTAADCREAQFSGMNLQHST
ncbi:MAG: pentapeptide repeat-containing protein [Longimicrobiales bacterium]